MTGMAITTWNRASYILDLLKSIKNQTMTIDKIVIVDNLSDNKELVEILQRLKSEGIPIISPSQQVGLDIARNMGLRQIADCDVQFIAEDAIYMAPNCIKNMVEFLNNIPEVGIVGPQHQAGVPHQNVRWGMKEFNLHFDTQTWETINSIMLKTESMQIGRGKLVSMVEGHLRGFKKAMVDQIGLPDEGYQKGWNVDTDYCATARHAGYHTAVVYRSLIWHYRDLFYPIESKEEWRKLGMQYAAKKYGNIDKFDRYILEGIIEKEY